MERVRAHRHVGGLDPHGGERHYFSAIVGLIGIASSTYGMLSAPSGKIPNSVIAEANEQRRRRDEAYSLQRMLQPYYLDQLGLEASYGKNGQITAIKKRAPTSDEQLQADVTREANQKVLKGLRGELDIDPATERALNEQEAGDKEYLRRALGPDYKLSTPGQSGMAKSGESRNITEAAVRTGEMTASDAIARGRMGLDIQNRQIKLGLLRGLPQDALGAGIDPNVPGDYQIAGDEFAAAAGRSAGWAGLGAGLLTAGAAGYGRYASRRNPYVSRPAAGVPAVDVDV